MRTRDVMTREVVTVTPDTAVREAIGLPAAKGFTLLPVVDPHGRLVGVVTEADALRDRLPIDPRSLVHGEPPRARAVPAHRVADVMSEPGLIAGPGADVAELARLMLDRNARSAPVVDGRRPVGIVTRRDPLRSVCRDDQAQVTEVRRRLALYAGPHRWAVTVTDGRVSIVDALDDDRDRHVAAVLAGAVPGVVEVDFPEARHAVGHG